MSGRRATSEGTLVLLYGEPIACCASSEAADILALCLERAGGDNITDASERELLRNFLA